MKITTLLFLVVALLVHIVPLFLAGPYDTREHIPYLFTYSLAFFAIAKYRPGKNAWGYIYFLSILYPLYGHFTGLIESIQERSVIGIIACIAVWIFLPIGGWYIYRNARHFI